MSGCRACPHLSPLVRENRLALDPLFTLPTFLVGVEPRFRVDDSRFEKHRSELALYGMSLTTVVQTESGQTTHSSLIDNDSMVYLE